MADLQGGRRHDATDISRNRSDDSLNGFNLEFDSESAIPGACRRYRRQLTDQTDNVLPVLAIIRSRQSDRVLTLATDENGNFHSALEPGLYIVRFEMSGFLPLELPQS